MHRHLSALSFLNNISLIGSKNFENYDNVPVSPVDLTLNVQLDSENLIDKYHDHSHVTAIHDSELITTSTSTHGSNNSEQFITFLESQNSNCFEAQLDQLSTTVHNYTSPYPTHNYFSSKRAHFSSNESLEAPNNSKINKIEVANGSDPNLHSKSILNPNPILPLQPGPVPVPGSQLPETKIIRFKSISNLTVRDERIVILVSQRTPVLLYSSLPYYRIKNSTRVTERPDVLNRRARNVSGSRPMSALSDAPDPLEQLIVSNEIEEVSYGYLLQPTKRSKPTEPTTTTPAPPTHNLASDVFKYSKNHHHVPISRCTSGDGNPKNPNPTGTTTTAVGNSNTPPGEEVEDGEVVTTTNTSSTGDSNETNEDAGGTDGAENIGTNERDKNWMATYSPHLLDDPEFRAGKHKTLLTFTSYITSVIDYCKASDLKKELNDKFRDRFPHIQLTLSKLKSLKREMRRVAKTECNIDLLTVAQAYVYFEKLILGSFVTKYNRKFCAGACLLLSAKLNDVKGVNLNNLIEMIERTFRVNRRELLSFEFAVLVALEFTLHLPTWEVFPHYQRLLYES